MRTSYFGCLISVPFFTSIEQNVLEPSAYTTCKDHILYETVQSLERNAWVSITERYNDEGEDLTARDSQRSLRGGAKEDFELGHRRKDEVS